MTMPSRPRTPSKKRLPEKAKAVPITPLGYNLKGAATRMGVSLTKLNQLIRPDPDTGEPAQLASFTIGRRRVILDEDIIDLTRRLRNSPPA
jgi:hypothetical protein